AAFRGLIDVLAHKVVPRPSIYGAEDELADADVVGRRRTWYWQRKYRRLFALAIFAGLLLAGAMAYNAIADEGSGLSGGFDTVKDLVSNVGALFLGYLPVIGILFFGNFLILFGPMIFLGAQQIRGY